MRNRIAVCGAALALSLGISAWGMSAWAADGVDVIAVRQIAFDLNNGDFAYIRSVVAAKGDVKQLEAPAKAIARWASVLPTLFPAGSDKGETKARSEIWSDNAGFRKVAATLGDAAAKLATDAKASNADAVAADAKTLGDACGACHRGYRAR